MKQRSHGSGSLFKRTESGCWIAAWYLHDGRRREKSTGTTDRAAAARILAKHVADAALRRDGVIDARTDGYAEANRKPLAEHVKEWKASLTAKGVTSQQVNLVTNRVTWLLNTCNAERIADLSASAVQAALGELKGKGRSLQSLQHYLRAIKQFSKWLRQNGRVREDALAFLQGYRADADRRYERRPFNPDELARLIRAAEDGEPWRDLIGRDRAMLYRVATGTGFRASELRSLTPTAFRLDGDSPCVMLTARASKRRTADVQPIRRDLADVVGAWLAGKPADEPLWPGAWHKRAAEMLRADLDKARQTWLHEAATPRERTRREGTDFLSAENEQGLVADFHSLRATFITLIVKGGVSVKVAQELARHSDPRLTLNTYTRLGIHDLDAALDVLPPLSRDAQATPLRATGTAGGPPDKLAIVTNRPPPGYETPSIPEKNRGFVSIATTKNEKTHGPREDREGTTERGTERGIPQKASTHLSTQLLSEAVRRSASYVTDTESCEGSGGISDTPMNQGVLRDNATQYDVIRRGGDSNPRSRLKPAKRFSKPSL